MNAPEPVDMKDKVVLVTGGSRGIGAAIARRFAREGAHLALNHRDGKGRSARMADELCREAEAGGGRAVAIPADISKKDAVKTMFAQVEEEFGRLDVLILNAARAPFKPWEKLLERDLKLLVETNFLGNVFCLQAALPLLSRRGGAVVFISSLGGRFYHPEYPLGPMKAAMEAAVRHWAESFEDKGVSVNAVCAGLVKTDSFKTLRRIQPELDALPERYFVTPEEVAESIYFLAGAGAASIRGQTLVVDRGLSNRLNRPPGDGTVEILRRRLIFAPLLGCIRLDAWGTFACVHTRGRAALDRYRGQPCRKTWYQTIRFWKR